MLGTRHHYLFKDRLGDFCRKFSIAQSICSMLNKVKKNFQPLFLQIKMYAPFFLLQGVL